MKILIITLLLSVNVVFLGSCNATSIKNETEEPIHKDSIALVVEEEASVSLKSYQQLDSVFVAYNYVLSEGMKNIPRVFVKNIAKSIRKLSTQEKKSLFVRVILSNTLKVNEVIASKRAKMLDLLFSNTLESNDSLWLDSLCKITHIKNRNYKALKDKYDIIPPSLVVAQAITESAWGTSHFAVEGNSLFGEHISHHAKGKYIQASGSEIRLRAFDSVEEAIAEYIANLNRNNAYKALRSARKALRDKKMELNGINLAEGELHYSEMGSSYVHTIQAIIYMLTIA